MLYHSKPLDRPVIVALVAVWKFSKYGSSGIVMSEGYPGWIQAAKRVCASPPKMLEVEPSTMLTITSDMLTKSPVSHRPESVEIDCV